MADLTAAAERLRHAITGATEDKITFGTRKAIEAVLAALPAPTETREPYRGPANCKRHPDGNMQQCEYCEQEHDHPLSRERAIEACARAGWEAAKAASGPHGNWSATFDASPMRAEHIAATERCLDGGPTRIAFRAAVLSEAARHPCLADEPALRGTR